MDFDSLLRKRASVREFSLQKVEYAQLLNAIEAASLAPSPGNLSLLRYVVVLNAEAISEIAAACQQQFILQAKALVVVCSVPKEADIMYDVRASRYVKQAAGAAIENFLLKISEMGLVSCWVGAFSDDTIKSALKIPDSVNVEAVLPVGYAKQESKIKQKPKPALGNILFFEKYKNKLSEPLVKMRK